MDEDWKRLGRSIAYARGRHWRSRAAFAQWTGVSERVLDDLETGARSNYSESTLAAVEAGLGWAPGTCMRVVQGGLVRADVDPLLVRFMDAWRTLPPEARELLVVMAEQASRARG